MPIHKDDEVLIFKGEQKGREGKVVCVYRKKYKIHVEKVSIDKINGMIIVLINVPFIVKLCELFLLFQLFNKFILLIQSNFLFFSNIDQFPASFLISRLTL